MFDIYEKLYGFDSEKSAKICMELGQIYELQGDINNAVDYYRNSYTIWEKIIKDESQYESLIILSMQLADLFEKSENYQNAYEILKEVNYFIIE
jgi:tetratricopeptide (TPR) repeat protein